MEFEGREPSYFMRQKKNSDFKIKDQFSHVQLSTQHLASYMTSSLRSKQRHMMNAR